MRDSGASADQRVQPKSDGDRNHDDATSLIAHTKCKQGAICLCRIR